MTTTLRPTGPENRTADGGRTRAYDICVNSRPVGAVHLAAEDQGGPLVGRIARLVVQERERRRGRGTTAALAAEEVLRGWGCARVEISAPVPAEAGQRAAAPAMLEALGYRERNRYMIKELDGPPALPEGSVGRPMTDEEFPAWWERGKEGYLTAQTDAGVPRETAEKRLEATRSSQLPAGPASPNTLLRVLTHRGTDVGTVWVSLDVPFREDADAWVFDVVVDEQYRGKGHGRSLMLFAEHECLAVGAPRLGLNVNAGNEAARHLYESLGYRAVELFYGKPLA
ncbi:GNAT family N-acetyltransferase [Streptomyces albiaxialis]|uniref:GNAT family N-acetyltransferase n=1 Tax=Streptomyces albiaxialis TaxID=329523 RepID=A0ABN2X275_9ACTN